MMKFLEGLLSVVGGAGIYIFGYVCKAARFTLGLIIMALVVLFILSMIAAGYSYGVYSGCQEQYYTSHPAPPPVPYDVSHSAAINQCTDRVILPKIRMVRKVIGLDDK